MEPLSIINTLLPVATKVLDRIPDPVAREKAQAEIERELVKAAMEQAAAQADINRIEAKSGSLLQAGWR